MLKVRHPIVMFVVVALVAIGIGLGVLTAPVPARSLRGRFRPWVHSRVHSRPSEVEHRRDLAHRLL